MRTVVIGAGASGLCSALILARYGHEVLLLEAGPRIAPLLRGFVREGLQCDTGFHQAGALGGRGILRKYLEFCGLLGQLDFFPFRKDCCELYRFAGCGPNEDFHLPQGLKAAAHALSSRWPAQRKEILLFFRDVQKSCRHSPFIDPGRFAPQNIGASGGVSLRRYFSGCSLPLRLQSLLSAHSIYYGVAPERALFEELALVTCSMLEDVNGITGGGAALAKAFEFAIAHRGIRVQTGCAARKILTDAGNAVKAIITAEGEEIPCERCIYTGHPAALPDLLAPGSLRPAMVRHLRSLEESPDFLLLFGGLKNDFLLRRSLFLCTTEDLNLTFKEFHLERSWLHISGGSPNADGEYPVCVACGVSPELRGLFSAAGRSDRSGSPNCRPSPLPDWKTRISGEIVAHLRRHVPEMSNFRAVELTGSHSLPDWVYGSTGSVYGIQHGADILPILPFTRVRNLLLAGQNIVLPGLLGTLISAALACGNIVGYRELFRDLACTNAE